MVEEIYRDIIEDSQDAYVCFEVENNNGILDKIKIIDMNKSYKKLSEQYEFYILDILPEEYRSSIGSSLNKKYSYEHYIDKDELCLYIDLYSGENYIFYLKIKVIKTLSMGEVRIYDIIRNAPFFAWIKDKDGNYVNANNKFIELTKLEYKQVIGKCDYDIWPKDTAYIFVKEDKKVIEAEHKCDFEKQVKLTGGSMQYLQTVVWPITDINGEIKGTIGLGLDVNEKVQLRNDIKRNEKFFQEISNNIDDVIIIRNKDKCIYVSKSFEKVFGFNPERLYEDIKLWHEEWENIELIDGSIDYNSLEVTSNISRVRNGKFDKWIQSRFVPVLGGNGQIIEKIGIISDITARKKLEEKLESLRMDFFANVSHEIRTPVTLILSCLQLLSPRIDMLGSEDKQYFDRHTQIMKQNSYRLLKLVNNLIDTTKIDGGNFTYNPQNHDIISFVENICMSVSQFVNMNNMNIIFDTDMEEKIISFDLDNMERIILNLLSNAIKYNKVNGNIEVNISCKDNIKISIKDNGIGIPKAKQDRVFERFGQVKNKMKTEHEGSGIGLFLVKSLVELNGGEIILNSELSKGSEFVVILPDIVQNDEVVATKIGFTRAKIDRMNIEFSDIYV
ncbi:sensor histidine kinase [Terrisporobacter mayombei]|uniref:histidine kinase n=1 Tax=Terrisporobacter mayombei TaxID=1541 RepID=A0ABY9Q4P5_9FIRM|nr:PAS domain-containing sensor histidine kinase [Terrisporobacter mayombei]MCC3868882.1 PAS domain-containing sensor histidine kinase [Terrisporobacter mayombei]WMT82983.1 Sensor histidine kinase RcsC [Terrisporobacter mayombei]